MLFILMACDPCAFHTYLVFLLSSVALIPQELFHFLFETMFLTHQQKIKKPHRVTDLSLGDS